MLEIEFTRRHYLEENGNKINKKQRNLHLLT